MKKEIFFILILVVLLVITNVFWYLYYSKLKIAIQNQKTVNPPQFNEKVLDFLSLFIKKVLKAENEVDFETRLKLENYVRQIGDKDILDQWNKFINSQTETEAQKNVKDLLELLAKKIKIK
jgi:hypothetical protein